MTLTLLGFDLTPGVAQVDPPATAILDIHGVFVNPVVVYRAWFINVHTGHPSPRYIVVNTVLNDPFVDRAAVDVALVVWTCDIFS